MRKVHILGAGKIGAAIAKHLHYSGDYRIVVGDTDAVALQRLNHGAPIPTQLVDATDPVALEHFLAGTDAVVSACSYRLNQLIAEVALRVGISYFDLTEDVATTEHIRRLSERAAEGQVFVPQCGLAPGFIGILAHHLCGQFEHLEKVKMRVGALPLYPSNMMMYNLTWSTDGLINEYCNPCEAIYDNRRIQVLPLEGLEHFSLDGVDYEAFNTSGGLGTLCETLERKVNALDYKTVRYKGHCYLMTFLTKSLRLANRREILRDILENAIPITLQDVVLVFCAVSGLHNGQLTQITDARKIYHQDLYGEPWSSIQLTTASGMAAMLDLHFDGQLPKRGFVRQEQARFTDLMANRFGRYFTPAR